MRRRRERGERCVRTGEERADLKRVMEWGSEQGNWALFEHVEAHRLDLLRAQPARHGRKLVAAPVHWGTRVSVRVVPVVDQSLRTSRGDLRTRRHKQVIVSE